MTIAVTAQVADGMVLAADSASTMSNDRGQVLNTYNHANKIVNLCKGKPIAVMFWGMGSIGGVSMSTLAKDLRERLSEEQDDWCLQPDWSVREVAERVRQFFYEQEYLQAVDVSAEDRKPSGGLAVCGYTPGRLLSERYEITILPDGSAQGPEDDSGEGVDEALRWRGQADAITRLVMGFGSQMPKVLVENFGLPDTEVAAAVDMLKEQLQMPPLNSAMPIQDVLDLAEFLVDMTKKWVRFQPGAGTVGGPIELAAITKHEGFRWVRRKFYYPPELNPQQ